MLAPSLERRVDSRPLVMSPPGLELEGHRALRALLVAIAAVVLLAMALAAGMLVDELRIARREQELVRHARAAGRSLSALAAEEYRRMPGAPVLGKGAGFVQHADDLLARNAEVAYVELVDAEGEIVWSSEPEDDRFWKGGQPGKFLVGGEERTRVPGTEEEEPDIFLEMVTAVGGRPPLGAVVLGLSEARVAAELQKGFWKTVAFLVGFGLAILGAVAAGYSVLGRRRGELIRRHARREHLAELGLLAAGLAHELRNPLNAMRFAVGSLQHRMQRVADPGLAQAMEEITGEIATEIAGADQIVSSFLTYARPPADAALQLCDLEGICRSAAAVVAPEMQQKQVTCALDMPAQPVALWVAPGRLRQILVNLLLNACQACTAGDHVVLRSGADAHRVLLTIEDDGPGVPAAMERSLFEPFATGRPDGTGLGLAICRRLVFEMEGAIDYQRRAGGGARFVVVLPRVRPSHPSPSAKPSAEPPERAMVQETPR